MDPDREKPPSNVVAFPDASTRRARELNAVLALPLTDGVSYGLSLLQRELDGVHPLASEIYELYRCGRDRDAFLRLREVVSNDVSIGGDRAWPSIYGDGITVASLRAVFAGLGPDVATEDTALALATHWLDQLLTEHVARRGAAASYDVSFREDYQAITNAVYRAWREVMGELVAATGHDPQRVLLGLDVESAADLPDQPSVVHLLVLPPRASSLSSAACWDIVHRARALGLAQR